MAQFAQSFQPRGMGPARPEGADVERLGLQRAIQRRVVQLRIMRQGDDRGAAVRGEGVQRLIRPVGGDLDIRETARPKRTTGAGRPR